MNIMIKRIKSIIDGNPLDVVKLKVKEYFLIRPKYN